MCAVCCAAVQNLRRAKSNPHQSLARAISQLVLGDEHHVTSAPANTEEGRALLQNRLALVGRVTSVIAVVFFLLALFVANYVVDQGNAAALSHVAMLAVNLVLWAIAGRPRQLGQTCLLVLDTLAAWANCGVFIVLGLLCYPKWGRPELFELFCVSHLLALRSFLVPSTALRTFLVGIVPVGAVVLGTYTTYLNFSLHPTAPNAGGMATLAGVLGLATMIVTTLTSRTIFSLRERVREAAQLGQYTLLEKIGEGGMGIVYKAKHAMLRRPTAIKLLPPDRAGEHNLARFEREVQLTSELTHPNTIAIYDYGRSAEGVLYYAMEYLEGLDLETLVALAGPQPPARVIHILTQVCGALEEAHGVGLIHRDIKPGNILLCARGGVYDVAKVVDFGLVKQLAAPQNTSASSIDQIIGTPLYMSPEAIVRPNSLTAASDLYALGAVGYFLLTGQPPFTGATVVEVCGHQLHTAPEPPSQRLGQPIPEALEAILLACLAKQPAGRPESAGELARRLQALREPSWSSDDARAFWEQHGDAITRHRQRAQQPVAGSTTLHVASAILEPGVRLIAQPWHSQAEP
jgi:serine/threonine protein kinase